MQFGLPEDQFDRAGAVLKMLALDWRDLTAGSEGFMTSKGRRGMWKRKIEWGDMVSRWRKQRSALQTLQAAASSGAQG